METSPTRCRVAALVRGRSRHPVLRCGRHRGTTLHRGSGSLIFFETQRAGKLSSVGASVFSLTQVNNKVQMVIKGWVFPHRSSLAVYLAHRLAFRSPRPR